MNNEVEKFEKIILDENKTGPVKYQVDNEIEAVVKYGFLCDTYGTGKVEETLSVMKLNSSDLHDLDVFEKVTNKLKEITE
jgi:hypothetical protein